jgi:hypothetical protein
MSALDDGAAEINPLYHIIEIVRAPILGTGTPFMASRQRLGKCGFRLRDRIARQSRRIVLWLWSFKRANCSTTSV